MTPMGSRMLKRWLHMPVRDTDTLVCRQQTIAALQDRYTELQPVLRQVGDLERILARGTAHSAASRPCTNASCLPAVAGTACSAERR